MGAYLSLWRVMGAIEFQVLTDPAWWAFIHQESPGATIDAVVRAYSSALTYAEYAARRTRA